MIRDPEPGDVTIANGVARLVLRIEREWVIYHVIGYPKKIESRTTLGVWRSWVRENRALTVGVGIELTSIK